MATFRQVFANLFLGSIVGLLSFIAFGLALRFGFNNQLAPRSWSRPKAILKNVLKPFYAFSWIPWAWRLTYPDLLEGIPGTGTRNGGWSGPLLKVNLDGVIMLKFYAMMTKLSVLSCILCMAVLIPTYFTAECDKKIFGLGTCQPIYNLTSFEQCTIVNLPTIDFEPLNVTVEESLEETKDGFLEENFWIPGVSWRYLVVVLCLYTITIYSCILLWQEWIDNLALRRVYYFENDHYQERMEELDSLLELKDPEDPFQQKRPPWLPHPELRETVPNVSLYSVLYKLPKKFVAMKPPADASDLDRQLTATVEFFDQCIPNQPGFSSSVVAATILPEAKHVALAWKEWYKCGKQLRKLRFIRSHIEERIRKQEEAEVIFVDADPPSVDQKSNFPAAKAHEENSIAADKTSEQKCESLKSTEEPTELQQYEVENSNKSVISSDETGKRKNKNENEIATKAIEQTTEKYSDKAANNNPTIYDDKSEVASAEFVAISKDRLAPVDGDCGFEPSENPFGALISGVKKLFYQQEEVTDESKVEVGDEVLDGQSHSETGLPKIAKSPGECSPERAVQFAEEDMLKVAENDTLLTKTKYRYDEFDMVKYAGVVGLYEEAGLEDLFSDFGIEQLSVYAREFAQGSSNACPFGCGEKAVKFASLKKLKMLEEKYVAAVNEANEELIEARATVSRLSSNVIGGESTNTGAVSAWKEEHANTKDEDAHDDNGKVDRIDLEAGTSKLNRESKSIRQRSKRASIQWEVANSIAQEIRDTPKRRKGAKLKRLVSVTSAQLLSPVRGSWNWLAETGKLAKDASRDAVIGVVEHSSYAVVTFTSRQAAIAARQCLADGGGVDRWEEFAEIPVAPLADAPPWNILFCRGCCRPVTLTISNNEKSCRRTSAITFFVLFCFVYTVPLAATAFILDPEELAKRFPDVPFFQNPDTFFYQLFAGVASGFVYTLFFSFCPQIFKAIANYEGNVSSMRRAEDKALSYFWYFMLLTAFTGTSLAQMLYQGFTQGLTLGKELKEVLREVAATIPTQLAPVWINWIIIRFTYTLPFLYFFQANTFGFSIIKWPWCGRLMRGGGPGGPPPYRIYVDGGTVFMCITALAPACPVLAPFALVYYVVFSIMLRWLLVFVYRPRYDGGGNKWPILHEVVISSLILGQVLLTALLLLRRAVAPAILIAIAIIPTLLFSRTARRAFQRAYDDAGLKQTSQLDGWDTLQATSQGQREEYRKWLVDCHKASYVPICLAGSDCPLTVEPSVVTEDDRDDIDDNRRYLMRRHHEQRGAFYRRGFGADGDSFRLKKNGLHKQPSF